MGDWRYWRSVELRVYFHLPLEFVRQSSSPSRRTYISSEKDRTPFNSDSVSSPSLGLRHNPGRGGQQYDANASLERQGEAIWQVLRLLLLDKPSR